MARSARLVTIRLVEVVPERAGLLLSPGGHLASTAGYLKVAAG